MMVWSMDATDKKILKAIDKVSPKSFVSPVKVNGVLKMDTTKLGNRLMLLKKAGYVDVMTSEYASSLTLPNAISRVHLTDLGLQTLKKTI
jgi:DNA-binding Lrp family transcriptional regulator